MMEDESEWTKQKTGQDGQYMDQRLFAMHRKQLADNIEKARKGNDEKDLEIQKTRELQKAALEERLKNKKAYEEMRKKHKKELEQMLAIGNEGLDEMENQEFLTRDGRDKTINI